MINKNKLMIATSLLSLVVIITQATVYVDTLITSGTHLKRIAGIRNAHGSRFWVSDSGDGIIKEITKHGRVTREVIPYQTEYKGNLFWGFADDLAVSSDQKRMALSTLFNGEVPEYNAVHFRKFANPQMLNTGLPIPPFFPSLLGFVNPITYDENDILYAANGAFFGLSNGVYRLDLVESPLEFKLFNKITGQFDTTASLNAFDFGANGKLYAPAFNQGSIFEIDLIEDSNGARAEYIELISGLVQPVSVRVNEDGLLITIDRFTGKVWKYNLNNNEQAMCIATLEPGLDNFDFFSGNKILVTGNRDRLWEVNLKNGRVKVRLEVPVALPQALAAGRSVDDFDKLYIADNYAIVIVNLFSGDVEDTLTIYDTPGLNGLSFIDGIHVTDTKIYASDSRTGSVAVFDRQTLAQLDFFGGFMPGNISISHPTYILEDHQGNLLVASSATGQVLRVTRVGGQQINEVVVDNVPIPLALARNGSTLYISDLGTSDTNGAVYTHDLSGSSSNATLLKNDLSRPKGLAVSGSNVLVVEALASQITSIDSSGNATTVVDNLDINYLPSKPSFFNPVPVGVISDITISQNGTVFFGSNATEGAVNFLVGNQ